MRRYEVECEKQDNLSLVSRGYADPHRVHFPQAHRHCRYSPAEQQTTNSNRSSLSCPLKTVRQLPDVGANAPVLWGWEAEHVLQPLLGMHPGFPHGSAGREEWAGKEKVLVHSLTRVLRQAWGVCPPCPLELWNPLRPLALTADRNCPGWQEHWFQEKYHWSFQWDPSSLSPPLFILRLSPIQTLPTIHQFRNKLRCQAVWQQLFLA